MHLNRTNIAFKSIKLVATFKNNETKEFSFNADKELEIAKQDNGFQFGINNTFGNPIDLLDLRIDSIDNNSSLVYYDNTTADKPIIAQNISNGGKLIVKDTFSKFYPSVNIENIDEKGKVELHGSKANINTISHSGSLSVLNESDARVVDNAGQITVNGIILEGNNFLNVERNRGNIEVDVHVDQDLKQRVSSVVIQHKNGKVSCGTKNNNITIHNGDKTIYPGLNKLV